MKEGVNAKIRLALRVVIWQSSASVWEKYVFEDTYREYIMQQQRFNDKEKPVNTYRELLSVNENAKQLDFLTGMAIESYVTQLKGNYYNVTDVLGNTFFSFEGYKLDIINTDITDMSRHKVGVTFFSPELTYLGIINNCYLVSKDADDTEVYNTVMYPVQANLAICSYRL